MSDLISRDNLSKYKEKLGCDEPIEVDAYYSGWNNAIDCIIKNEPSAQTEPKKGQWEEKSVFEGEIQEWQSARCSVCNKYHTTPYLYYFDSFNYCPNCGASMEVTK